jgi:diaminopimelate epimerase
MRFEKWQALGNDYLIVEREALAFELTPARVRRLCEGHFGVFADGVLLLARSDDPRFVADLRIFNPDGSEAELSGNGAREAILYLRRRGWTEQDSFSINTVAGVISPTITGADTCRVDMGHASLTSKDFPGGAPDGIGELTANGRTWRFQHVSIGNPQCAIHVADLAELESLDLPALGPAIEGHESFPHRTNVSWYTEIADPDIGAGTPDVPGAGAAGRIRARIFERGVGETLSSGTGASGAAIANHLRLGANESSTTVALDGGELEVEVGESLHVDLTGWARPVFAGELSAEFVKELNAMSSSDDRQRQETDETK